MSEAADAARKPAVFLLSPARLDGVRARLVFEPKGYGGLSAALRTREGAPIGEVFQLLSGLYFRGKLAYARRFARPPAEVPWIGSGVLVITANRGLVPAEARVTIEHLEAFAQTDIHHAERQFRGPLVRDAELLRRALGDDGKVVLLGSIAQAKYTAPLLEVFGERLLFPGDFVGRGDMSRGGLLLRAAEGAKELDYVPVKGATLRGRRPPKLEPRTRR
ncbi:MAG TPA: hypothetical protein VM925_01885 [Labilithrix sp.]|nr:hypothetical protein [Labilithrix sp.]